MARWRPTSLAGQLALLVALALFAAQAINFALLLAERRERSFNGAVVPAITRVVAAAERLQNGDWRGLGDLPARPARSIVVSRRSRASERMMRNSAAESRLRTELDEAGIRYRQARAGTLERPRARAARGRSRKALLLAVELADNRWVSTRAILGSATPALGRLLAQTALIYALLLLAVLWIGRRAARPLASLTDAAANYGRGGQRASLAEQGPADVRRLIAAFNAMDARIGTMLSEKDQMLGAIGHDLRTPLASLRVRAEGVADPDERARTVATIEEMDRMLGDILSLARLGRSSEAATRVDLAALVDALVEDFRDLGRAVAFEASERLPVMLKPELIRRALRNLLDNAVAYGASATVRVRRAGTRALIEIDDEGPGITPAEIENMFEGFARLEGSRNRDTGGAGLGLTLARAVVRDGGGDVTLENRPDGGLRATLWLPTNADADG